MGDEFTTEDGIRMVVEQLDKNRVQLVHVYLPEKADEDSEDEREDSDEEQSERHERDKDREHSEKNRT